MTIDVPPAVATLIATLAEAPNGGRLRTLNTRSRERGDPPDTQQSWALAGIASDPVLYGEFDTRLTELFRNQSNLNMPGPGDIIPEVVIGSGYQAAVYCAIRHNLGFPKPLVIETSSDPGGVFAVTRRPSFFLNSESTGGMPGAPWEDGPNNLNWLPGGPVQACQIGGREIPDNTVMRFCIRAALIIHARVITRRMVTSVQVRSADCTVVLADGNRIICRRVIDARGAGPEKAPACGYSPAVMSWAQAMAHMDRDFPFEGMRRVAVVGDGKSALCAAEALLGVGPDSTLRSPAMGGIPERVDVYGTALPTNRAAWLDVVETRYARLAAHLPVARYEDENGDVGEPPGFGKWHDLYVTPRKGEVSPVPGGVLVNGRFYDAAIWCAGHEPARDLTRGLSYVKGRAGGRFACTRVDSAPFFRVGPVAQLPFDAEDIAAGITLKPDNKDAMFRLGPLTAALAASLVAA